MDAVWLDKEEAVPEGAAPVLVFRRSYLTTFVALPSIVTSHMLLITGPSGPSAHALSHL